MKDLCSTRYLESLVTRAWRDLQRARGSTDMQAARRAERRMNALLDQLGKGLTRLAGRP